MYTESEKEKKIRITENSILWPHVGTPARYLECVFRQKTLCRALWRGKRTPWVKVTRMALTSNTIQSFSHGK